jgi:hypothetical protein
VSGTICFWALNQHKQGLDEHTKCSHGYNVEAQVQRGSLVLILGVLRGDVGGDCTGWGAHL